jgi:hypothetical protein
MIVLAALTLLMRLVENAWLVLPGLPPMSWAVAPLILAASLAMLGFGWVGAVALHHKDRIWNERGWAGEWRSTP